MQTLEGEAQRSGKPPPELALPRPHAAPHRPEMGQIGPVIPRSPLRSSPQKPRNYRANTGTHPLKEMAMYQVCDPFTPLRGAHGGAT